MSAKRELVVVANRLPVRRVRRGGKRTWAVSPGGLVSAMRAAAGSRGATWVGTLGTAQATEPFEHENIHNVPVAVSREEMSAYYHGVSNRTFWPLYHHGLRVPRYRREWWDEYVKVNQRFAQTAADVAGKNALVWVHDYHLQLVPRMLRELRSDVRIGFFLHIPFPPAAMFLQLPWRREVVDGLLGADVLGFQSQQDASAFEEVVRGSVAAPSGPTAGVSGRRPRIGAFPISIDFEKFDAKASSEETEKRAARLRKRLGQNRVILLGVDRLDYTKGIDARLEAFYALLEAERLDPKECVMVQVAVPSRDRVPDYARLRDDVDQLVGQINGDFGDVGRVAVHYMRKSYALDDLVALYRAADVLIVNPFRDGMNLVAKEYVASRSDEGGRLVLSEFTGAAHELTEAVFVNPWDQEGLADGIEAAVRMDAEDARRRMHAMREVVRHHTVHHWAERFLGELQRRRSGGARSPSWRARVSGGWPPVMGTRGLRDATTSERLPVA